MEITAAPGRGIADSPTGSEPTNTPTRPELRYSDSAGCRRWLERLPLTNVPHAQRELAGQLAALHGAGNIAPLERLRILETLKEAVQYVQEEAAGLYAGRPLPLEHEEADTWARSTGLWQALLRNYESCLEAYREGDLIVAPYSGLITLRCLACVAWIMEDHYRVYRLPSAALWRELHGYYQFAEQRGFARIRIHDNFGQRDPDSSCAEVYVQAILMALANPFSLSVREQDYVRHWLAHWASQVNLAQQPPPASQIPPLVIDLASTAGARFAGPSEPVTARHLDLEALAKTLRQGIQALKQGQTPEQAGLGDRIRPLACEQLLMTLYVQWCRAGTARGEDRLDTEEKTTVCFGLAAAHCQARGGLSHNGSGNASDYEHAAAHPGTDQESMPPGPCGPETWLIRNASPSGFMCMTRHPDSTARIAHNQLLAVRRENGRQFHLGMVQWVKVDGDGELQCGVKLFPGTPQAVTVRPSNFNPAAGSGHVPALVLPEVPAPATPATLVLPAGWFQSGRFVEIFAERKQVAKLLNLLEKGSDFDRGTITIV